MKGVLNPDHIPVNNYALIVPGMPNFTPTNITGLEEELEKVSLPDRTAASGGHTKDGEFTVTLPLHHTREQQAMERWYVDSQEPVAPDYKKPATLVLPSISGMTIVTFLAEGIFPCGRKTSDLEMGNEGDMHVVEWKFAFDKIRAL